MARKTWQTNCFCVLKEFCLLVCLFGVLCGIQKLCMFACLFANTQCYLSSYREGKEVLSIPALFFKPKSFHGIILGIETFQTQCHAVNLVEQLYKICSAILK